MNIRKRTFRILDLDNCISDDSPRLALIDWTKPHPNDRYRLYHEAAGDDKPGNLDLFDEYAQTEHSLIVCTARPIAYSVLTRRWLEEQGVKPFALLMRNNPDTRPSVAVKATQLQWLFDHYGVTKDRIADAYDDRQEIVDMYLSHGIAAYRRWIHDGCAMTKPEAA
jgi:hypothetical protein